MSPSDPEAVRQLAEWRREGYGIWKVIFIAEGYDDEFTYLLRGKLTKSGAEGLGRMLCSRDLKINRKFVHLKSQEKQP